MLLQAGGLELLVDIVAYAHTGGAAVEGGGGGTGGAAAAATAAATGAGASAWDHLHHPAATTAGGGAAGGPPQLLTPVGHDDMPREWFLYPRGVIEAKHGSAAAAASPSGASDLLGDLLGDPVQPAIAAPAGGGSSSGSGSSAQQQQQQQQQQEELLGKRPDETGRCGPFSRDELRQLAARGAAEWGTPVWAAGMGRPVPLGAVRELRWMLAKGE